MRIERVNILGVGVHATNLPEAVDYLIDAARAGQKGYVCVTGAHGIIESQSDPQLKLIHNRSLLTVPDGMPSVWLGRLRGHRRMRRVYGPELMAAVFAATTCPDFKPHRMRHFLCGATDDTLARLRANLQTRFPGVEIAGMFAPPFRPMTSDEEAKFIEGIATARPDFVWVGLSTPKQERFMDRYISRLETTVMVGIGAAFDIHAGLLRDAPNIFKETGLQWFYRLCQNPRRLWKRYGVVVPRFLLLSLLQATGFRHFSIDIDREERP